MKLFLILPAFALTACGAIMPSATTTRPGAAATPAAAATLNPSPPPRPPAAARTVTEFDTTTDADRAAALDVQVDTPSADLGTTLATLGSPTEPGIWLKTPLVDELTPGRVSYNGTDANVELRPSGGAAGSGSQISLAAMRVLNIPLTEIAEVTVSAR